MAALSNRSTSDGPQNETGNIVMLRSGAYEPVRRFHEAVEYFNSGSIRVTVKHR